MATIIDDYFSPGWRERSLDCPCGWSGATAAMRMQLHETATDYACPGCESTLMIVAHPDLAQVRQAAAAGNAEAAEQLALVEEARRQFSERPPQD
jgi:hypothetical protein